MRALGEELGKFAESVGPAIQQLLAEGADFHTRYTLLAPLARISNTHPALLALLVELITSDEQPAVRTEAARLTPVLPASVNSLLKATTDPEPRVREAAIANLGSHQTDAARTVLQLRLRDDKWPFVRSASVRALAGLPADAETNAALAFVVERDTSPAVRRPAVLALGKLAAREQLRVLRATYELDVDAHVRAAAAAALGQLCDAKSLELMTKRAVTLATLSGSEDELVVAKASLGALGRLGPPDLRQRLKPFGGAKTPAPAREAARAALTYHDVCSKQPSSP
jgi:HEAT repeat protein